jgi:hypothetical protein
MDYVSDDDCIGRPSNERKTYSQVISFTEITLRPNSSVRVTNDNLMYAVDLVMIVMNQDKRDYACQVLRTLKNNTFQKSKFITRQLSQRGGHKTKLLTFDDAIELVMVLPGKRALQIRKHFKDIIVRYLDGDRSMCSEILANEAMGKVKIYKEFTSRFMHTTKENHETPQTKYVYATKSSAFPGLIKIGKTENIKTRLSGLKIACAPAPHFIVAVAPSLDYSRDEKTAHDFFSTKRRAGEFFEVDEAEVIAFFTAHITAKYNVELMQKIDLMQGCTFDD